MEIKNTSELVKETKVNMLLYGSPGSGKTTIAGTFPKALYLNIEAGVSTLQIVFLPIKPSSIKVFGSPSCLVNLIPMKQ